MIPIKDPAGSAAAVVHDQPEWAPDQYADQVAYVEQDTDHKQARLADDAIVI